MRRLIGILLFAAGLVPIHASDPGDPLDCSDWVLLEPGLSCVALIPYPCEESPWCPISSDVTTTDNHGRFFQTRRFRLPPIPCPNGSTVFDAWRTELVAFDGISESLVAYIEDRCGPIPFAIDRIWPDATPDNNVEGEHFSYSRFNAVNGHLCAGFTNHSFSAGLYDSDSWIACFEGFPTLAETLPPGPEGPQGPPGPLIPACPDADGDAWADCVTEPTCNPYGHPCGDCDDSNAAVFPGAPGSRDCETMEEPIPIPSE